MGFSAKILADSLHPSYRHPAPATPGNTVQSAWPDNKGLRLTTIEATYPRIIHAEWLTHRQFSRNSASSRAIPIEKMLDRVVHEPFVPIEWGSNKPGMVAGAPVDNPAQCEQVWLLARDNAVAHARHLSDMGLHKQIVNRIVEPWMWITVIYTGVDHAWENFFNLRCHPEAEPHIRHIAEIVRAKYDTNTPRQLRFDEYHLPLTGFAGDDTLTPYELAKVSTGRTARVSYLTHDGKRDVAADIGLYDRLEKHKHFSPFEHVASPAHQATHLGGNFGPAWVQLRKTVKDEYCTKAPR